MYYERVTPKLTENLFMSTSCVVIVIILLSLHRQQWEKLTVMVLVLWISMSIFRWPCCWRGRKVCHLMLWRQGFDNHTQIMSWKHVYFHRILYRHVLNLCDNEIKHAYDDLGETYKWATASLFSTLMILIAALLLCYSVAGLYNNVVKPICLFVGSI